jgi:mono/diheme cytochrome c family protein
MKIVGKGEELFSQRCAFCHSKDSTDTIVGPGLKGLFSLEAFPVSRLPATRESVQHLLKKPYKDMPAFDQLKREEITALLDYLETL